MAVKSFSGQMMRLISMAAFQLQVDCKVVMVVLQKYQVKSSSTLTEASILLQQTVKVERSSSIH